MGTFYENNPDLRFYFESLPIYVKNKILESREEIYTLEDLKQAAMRYNPRSQGFINGDGDKTAGIML